jgi:PAP2 superfamily
MKSSRVSLAAVVVLAGVLSANPTPARALPGNIVTEWNLIAVTTLIGLPGPAGGAPPTAQVNVGMVQGAVYDAVNATEPKHNRPYLLNRRFSARASQEAAVATAAYRVLDNIVSTVPAAIPFPNRASLLASLVNQYNASLDAIQDSPFKTQGIAAGNAAAEAMIAARENDGRFGPSQWMPNTGIGHWQPLPGTADPTPWVGGVKPFLMQSSSQFRTDGPYALDTAEYADDYNEVKDLGAVNSATRTGDQTHIALFWQSTPVATWNAVTRDLVNDPGFNIGLADSARLLAMQNLSAADAAINCWNDKYFWDFWRPVNAIRSTDDDVNSETEPDPSWTPLINAPYPEHPSGHLCLDGAHLGVLEMFLGTDDISFGVTSIPFPGEIRPFGSFSEVLDEITEARIWAGLHFRNADVQGRDLGRNVAEFAAANYFQPVGNH